jgi:uncharacterized protein (DUF302 family)
MKNIKFIASIAIMMFALNTLSAQQVGEYYHSKVVKGTFEEVTQKVKDELKKEGFSVITEIDMDAKLKEKLGDIDMPQYKILGVCNPSFAYKTLMVEENIGLFLPCKTLVKDIGDGKIEVVMVNPSVLMSMLEKEELAKIAEEVLKKFLVALDNV